MWQLVLTDLTCGRETSGRGDDEVVALFRIDGTHPDTGQPVTQVTGLAAEDCSTGTCLVSGATLTGVAPIGSFGISQRPPGIELMTSLALESERLAQPSPPFTVSTIGLEVDGSDSALDHGNEYITEFARTGTVDPTVGVDDDILWGLSWTIQPLPDGTLRATAPSQIFPDPVLGGTFAPTWVEVSEAGALLRQTVLATNSDQSSSYTFTIECVGV